MAKIEAPQIYVQRRANHLIPEMEMDADLIQRIPLGQRVKITVTEGRSPAKLRLYWSYLGRVVKACNCAPSPEALHDVVKLHTGFVTPVLVKGFTVAVPKSISFSSMSESEFDDFLRTAEKWISQTYGITPEQAFDERAA